MGEVRGSSGEQPLEPLPRAFYVADARDVGPRLLNKVLVHGACRARIVEVEAYVGGGEDPGSHAHRGLTPRNRTMFGPPGHLYVYFSYGMHWCANAVCSEEGTATAVLLRAAEPLSGLAEMQRRRPAARSERDLLSGPAKLCQALAIDGSHDEADLVEPLDGGPFIADDGVVPPERAPATRRIGLTVGADLLWRWHVPGSLFLSRPERGGDARPV